MMVSGRMYHVPGGLRMNDARSVVIACDKREAFAQGANGSAQSAARWQAPRSNPTAAGGARDACVFMIRA
jgi:hypothetical protein